jgi:hypothetical protein
MADTHSRHAFHSLDFLVRFASRQNERNIIKAAIPKKAQYPFNAPCHYPFEYEYHSIPHPPPRGFLWAIALTPGCKNIAMLIFLPGSIHIVLLRSPSITIPAMVAQAVMD